jgi:hypothetical protein
MTTVVPVVKPVPAPVKKIDGAENKSAFDKLASTFAMLIGLKADTDSVDATYKALTYLFIESIITAVIATLFVFAMPLYETRYIFSATTPENNVSRLVPLAVPNLTNSAIKSWADSSVTEILTIGFGDFNRKLIAQRQRFTTDGWGDFVRAFLDRKVGESFRKSQLVLTTVPSDTPIIESQGSDEEHLYKWEVKVPVIMTYATNNEVTKTERSTITLTLVRVPYNDASRGVAIDNWRQR